MVILLSTRGTAGSVNWFMCLADRPMVRGHHLRDKDWTPLSPNPVQICNDIVGVLVLRGNNILSFPLRWLSHSKRLKSSVIAGGLVVWYSHFERENTIVCRRLSFYDLLRLILLTGRFVCLWRTFSLRPVTALGDALAWCGVVRGAWLWLINEDFD